MYWGENKRAQSVIQFVILIAFMFIVFLVFMGFQGDKIIELEHQKEYVLLKDMGLKIASEVNLATTMKDGYTRNFFIPDKLEGIDYGVTQINDEVVLTSQNEDYSVTIPQINGTIFKGNNTIKSINSVVCINEGCD